MVKPRENRVPIMMSEEELTAIDDWRFKNRIATRSEAIRRLCQIGLVFDDHRAEYVERYGGLLDVVQNYQQLAKVVSEKTEAGERVSNLEKAYVATSLQTMIKVLELFDLVRTTTGIANNLKSADEIEKIMAEVKEILAAPGIRDAEVN